MNPHQAEIKRRAEVELAYTNGMSIESAPVCRKSATRKVRKNAKWKHVTPSFNWADYEYRVMRIPRKVYLLEAGGVLSETAFMKLPEHSGQCKVIEFREVFK